MIRWIVHVTSLFPLAIKDQDNKHVGYTAYFRFPCYWMSQSLGGDPLAPVGTGIPIFCKLRKDSRFGQPGTCGAAGDRIQHVLRIASPVSCALRGVLGSAKSWTNFGLRPTCLPLVYGRRSHDNIYSNTLSLAHPICKSSNSCIPA